MSLQHPSPPPARRAARRLTAAAAVLAAALAGAVGLATAAPGTAAEPGDGEGGVILTMFQWTWDAVADECATVGEAGFGYVQVSPPQENLRGSAWWTSYQVVSYQVESKLGTRAEFAAMVEQCRAAGVGVIADAVINHTTGADMGSGTGVAGSAYGIDSAPAVPYGAGDFNACRTNVADYQDAAEVQGCRLVGLQDLRTGSEHVRDAIAAYLDDLVDLGVAGFRIDAAKHIPAADLAAVKGRMDHPDVYWVQEVIGSSPGIAMSDYAGTGDVHEFSYATRLRSAFEGSLTSLRTIGQGLLPSAQAGVFVDNHDTERNGETLNQTDGDAYLLANVFMLAHPYGAPAVYTGYTFTDKDAGAPGATSTTVPDASCDDAAWTCTHRIPEIAGMVGFHDAVAGTALTDWYDDGVDLVAFGREDRGHVVINDRDGSQVRTFTTALPDGTYCDVVASATCSRTVTVAGGRFTTVVPAHGAVALHVDARTGGTPTPTPSATAVTGLGFAADVTTVWGQNVSVVGDVPELGAWEPTEGVALSSATYPVWRGSVALAPGTRVEYKYVHLDETGKVAWETGANRVATVPASGVLTLTDTWRD
ncbi:carbohydrate-binding module family 20 domain-containing protein [Cellulomonas oligotrophica]|uniref:Alpha-amylase n=1 Tax=Cellulomonas oligotrophica TaxID=931536 RepID=A0A7Y9FFY0_9CELL|nr:carbohydrate-binding module family 20 domain-containing protein [Cellulomonas oligotrophica]NYD86490.1 alpha-amylase [Cellulomonas oligotrophica]GIG32619.1 hypothetical protein Col01nite_17780 [Cellulomonas oligotrophica]